MIFDESISKNRAVLVALRARSLSPEENSTVDSVEELAALLETAGGENVGNADALSVLIPGALQLVGGDGTAP